MNIADEWPSSDEDELLHGASDANAPFSSLANGLREKVRAIYAQAMASAPSIYSSSDSDSDSENDPDRGSQKSGPSSAKAHPDLPVIVGITPAVASSAAPQKREGAPVLPGELPLAAHPLGDLDSSWLAEEAASFVQEDQAMEEEEEEEEQGPVPPQAPGVAGFLPLSDGEESEHDAEEDFERDMLRLLSSPETDQGHASRELEAGLEGDFLSAVEAVSDKGVRRFVAKQGAKSGLDLESALDLTPGLDLDGLIARLESGATPRRPVAPPEALPSAQSLFMDFTSNVGGGRYNAHGQRKAEAAVGGDDPFYSQDAYRRRNERRARTLALKTPSASDTFDEEGEEGADPGMRPFEESIATLLQLTNARDHRGQPPAAEEAPAPSSSVPSTVRLDLSAASAAPAAPEPRPASGRPRAIDRFMQGAPPPPAPAQGRRAPLRPDSDSDSGEDDLRAQRSRIKSGRKPTRGAAKAEGAAPPMDRTLLESLVNEVMTHPRRQAERAKVPESAPAAAPAAIQREESGASRGEPEEVTELDAELEHVLEGMRHKKEEREAALDLEARRLGVKELLA